MCGIAGRLAGGGLTAADAAPLADALAHRGPDDCGTWSDGICALGHRRLAIIDLSPAGRQPMTSADGTVCVTFNGEIYNYRELRDELTGLGHRFRTATDTEVIVEAYRAWGTGAVARLDGMFAFGLWDAPRRRLLLVRDRVGKKPLYYTTGDRELVFASEVQGILADPCARREMDPRAIDAYLTWGYVPPPATAFAGIAKLPPAHWMTVEVTASGLVRRQARYWSLAYAPKLAMTEEEAADELRRLLTEAVRRRLMSDVPLGAFLSGGIDSSIVAGLMAGAAAGRVPTFSIGFADSKFNELPHARAVAARWGTDHHEFVVEPDALAILPELVRHYGEPFADSSSIPTYYVSKLSRRHVTVALSGDGGDEDFAGYDRYAAIDLAERVQAVPGGARLAAAAARLLPDSPDARTPVRRLKRFLAAVRLPAGDRYAAWRQYFSAAQRAVLYTTDMQTAVAGQHESEALRPYFTTGLHVIDAAMAADVETYLPGDLMAKVDVVSMANGLEVRSPFLDHHLMEFAARLPVRDKLRGRHSKYLLKRACADLLPAAIASRSKMGFGVPIGSWFRGSLREFLYDTLVSGRARERGLFEPAAVRALVDGHVVQGKDHAQPLWNLLMLELWQRECLDRAPRPTSA